MSVGDNKAAIRHFWNEHLSIGDAALCEGDFTPTAVNRGPHSPPLLPGPESISQLITLCCAAFPDLTATIEDMVAEADEVAYRLAFRGTRRGEMLGIPTTGKQVTYTAVGIDKVINGTIMEMWLNCDARGMLQQMGAVPRPGSTAGKTSEA